MRGQGKVGDVTFPIKSQTQEEAGSHLARTSSHMFVVSIEVLFIFFK